MCSIKNQLSKTIPLLVLATILLLVIGLIIRS